MRVLSSLVFLVSLLLGCAAGSEGQTKGSNRAHGDAPDEPPAPLPTLLDLAPEAPRFAMGTAKVVETREDVPLSGKLVRASASDFVLKSEGRVAVISSKGSLIDAGLVNGKDGLVSLDSVLQMGLSVMGTDVGRVDLVGEKKNIVRVLAKAHGKPLGLAVFYSFGEGGVLWMESVAFSTPEEAPQRLGEAHRLPALVVTLGEMVDWGNVPTWAEGEGLIRGGVYSRSDFIARGGIGTSYAICSEEGPLYAKFGSLSSYGYVEAILTGERVIPVVVGGVSERRRVALSISDRSSGEAALALPCGRAALTKRVSIPTFAAYGATAVLVRCEKEGVRRPWMEIGVDAQKFGVKNREIDLPEGCFEARLSAPGYLPGPLVPVSALATEPREKVLPSAGKVKLHVTAGLRKSPARLLVRGIAPTPDPDWGDEPHGGAALNVAYLDHGEAELPLPPGKYHLAVGRGFSYSAFEQDIEVLPGKDIDVAASIERVVDTSGFVSADLHVHADPSPDAPVPLEERVRSLVAAGVEVAVATDHNAVTDYGPVIRDMGLAGDIAGVVGDEVTTEDPPVGHFNVFPMAPTSKPLLYEGVLPAEVFGQARHQQPYGAFTLTQVNHPRWGGIGYFELLRLDTEHLKASLERSPLADMGFDLFEVYNGASAWDLRSVEVLIHDHFALVNAGFRVVATGNSDSHKTSYHEAGLPRNMVFVGGDGLASFSEARFVDALKQGKVSVSGGPFVWMTIASKTVGEDVAPGEHDVVVRLDGPAWVDVNRVDLMKRGKLIHSWPVSGRKGSLTLLRRETLVAGDWLVAIARGDKPMDVYVPGVRPFGLTNPVYVR